jgi:Predicted membrane protein
MLGKRQIAQLQPFELVVIIMISELAAVPSGDIGIPLISGIIPILILLISGITLQYLTLKSEKARSIICGKPTILIDKGKILETEIKRIRYNISDLLEQLRIKNIPNISDVEYAILETNGEMSVIPKSQKRPTIPEDFQITTKYEGLPLTLIMDGIIQTDNLKKANVDLQWLQQEMKKQQLTSFDQVLLASLDTAGTLFIQGKMNQANS